MVLYVLIARNESARPVTYDQRCVQSKSAKGKVERQRASERERANERERERESERKKKECETASRVRSVRGVETRVRAKG